MNGLKFRIIHDETHRRNKQEILKTYQRLHQYEKQISGPEKKLQSLHLIGLEGYVKRFVNKETSAIIPNGNKNPNTFFYYFI
jgi:hypothetical protein